MNPRTTVLLVLALAATTVGAGERCRLSVRWAQDPPTTVVMEVEESPEGYIVSARDAAGALTSRASFDRAGRAVEYVSSGLDGEAPYTVTARLDGRLDVARGGRRTTVEAADPYVPEGESQYWLFSRWLASDPAYRERAVSFFDPDGSRVVGMRVRKVGTEAIQLAGRPVSAVRTEVSLSSPVLRLFWPHVYVYCFAADDCRFLAYEGRDRDGRIGRIEVTE